MTHTRRTGPTRQEQKARTRQALLDAALSLMEHQSLSSVGLREITRAVGIAPTAFYRHFPDVESLGVALVEECLGTLRTAIRSVRDGMSDREIVIDRSFDVLVEQVGAHRDHFRFIAREQHGGVRPVREAIRAQLELFGAELATDLATTDLADLATLRRWRARDLKMITELIVNHMIWTAAALLEAPPDDPAAARQVVDTAARQLRLIILGAREWPA